MNEIKFCKDCKFFYIDKLDENACSKGFLEGPIPSEMARKSELYCGAKSKYFELKEKVDE